MSTQWRLSLQLAAEHYGMKQRFFHPTMLRMIYLSQVCNLLKGALRSSLLNHIMLGHPDNFGHYKIIAHANVNIASSYDVVVVGSGYGGGVSSCRYTCAPVQDVIFHPHRPNQANQTRTNPKKPQHPLTPPPPNLGILDTSYLE